MKSKRIRKILLAAAGIMVILAGCEKSKLDIRKQENGEVAIPVSFLVNPDTGENENEELVEAFNQAYQGRYHIEVDWISDSAEGYRSRIKTLNGLDKLPAVITDVGFDADFYHLLVAHDRLVDLHPFMEGEAAWIGAYDKRVLEVCREENGSLFLSPSGGSDYSYAGFYYNKELFQTAGISDFPKTWEEFFDCLKILKGHGIVPLAIHGGSSYWTPLLIATNYMAGTEEGMKFLKQQYPKDFQNQSAADMFRMLKELYQYADADALKVERIESARRFVEGKSAITANGGWMIANFSSKVKERTGFAPFPGNILMKDPKMSAWSVTSGYPEDVTEGAVEFLKFRALWNEKVDPEEEITTVEKEYKEAVNHVETITPNYQLQWESSIQEDFFVNELPLYVEGKVSGREFISRLNKAVEDIFQEK